MTSQLILAESLSTTEQFAFYLLPLIGSVMLAYSVFNLVRDLRKVEARKIEERLRDDGGLRESDTERVAKESILRRQQQASGQLSAAIARMGFIPQLQSMLDQANIPWSATTLLVNLLGISSAAYIACYFWGLAVWMGPTIAAGCLGLPIAVIYFLKRHRLYRFMLQLPDVFELMSQALRAGHSLANAILVVSQQLREPAGTEFARVFHEQNLGIKIEDALKDMAKRISLMDVKFFVTAVLIQRQTGGDLAEVLDNISGVIRERIKLFGSVKALTAEGRLSGYILLALPVVVFLLELVVNPNYANVMLEEQLGQYMLAGAGVSQILGLLMIQKIVNIKV